MTDNSPTGIKVLDIIQSLHFVPISDGYISITVVDDINDSAVLMMRWGRSFPSHTSIGKNHEVIAKNIIKYKFATFMLLASGVILSEELRVM